MEVIIELQMLITSPPHVTSQFILTEPYEVTSVFICTYIKLNLRETIHICLHSMGQI